MSKKARQKRIKVVYRQVDCDPAEARRHMERAFEVLFEATLRNYTALKEDRMKPVD